MGQKNKFKKVSAYLSNPIWDNLIHRENPIYSRPGDITPTLEIKAAIQIQRSPAEVFEAIVDPLKMSNYFISNGSGRMEEGKTISWKFPEFNMEFPIRVGKIEKDQYISYYWEVD